MEGSDEDFLLLTLKKEAKEEKKKHVGVSNLHPSQAAGSIS